MVLRSGVPIEDLIPLEIYENPLPMMRKWLNLHIKRAE